MRTNKMAADMVRRIFIFALAFSALCLGANLRAETESAADAAKTGEFERAESLADILGSEAAQALAGVIDPERRVEWRIYAPPSYDPARPAGVFIYISPTRSGAVPAGWKPALEARNLIWISVNNSGNRKAAHRRIGEALISPIVAEKYYAIDASRIYVSGFSGGGRIASIVATLHPDLFAGAMYICGVNFWKDPAPEALAQIQDNRYVFITGAKDTNLDDTKNVYGRYLNAGVRNAKLMVIRGMGHATPKPGDFDEALDYLTTAGR